MPAYDELESEVIEEGFCTYCGACVASCPLYHLKWIDGGPKRPEKKAACEDCEVCYHACYRTKIEKGAIEEEIFGRRRKEGEDIGIYRHVFAARANDEEILKKAQDGGIVTAILTQALNENIIEGAVLVNNEGWMPKPSVARSFDDFIAAAGTKYGISPNLIKVRTAIIDHALDNICIVGTPCHVQAVRHLQHIKFDLSPAITFVIGLFCRENYEYEQMCERVKEKGVGITEIEKISVSEHYFDVCAGGNKLSFSITEAKKWIPKHCLVCEDYTNELSDISIGCDGSEEGWSTVIIRTEKGEKIFSGLKNSGSINVKPIYDPDYVKEVSIRKRSKAKQTEEIFRLKEEGYGVKEIAMKLGISQERVLHRLEKFEN